MDDLATELQQVPHQTEDYPVRRVSKQGRAAGGEAAVRPAAAGNGHHDGEDRTNAVADATAPGARYEPARGAGHPSAIGAEHPLATGAEHPPASGTEVSSAADGQRQPITGDELPTPTGADHPSPTTAQFAAATGGQRSPAIGGRPATTTGAEHPPAAGAELSSATGGQHQPNTGGEPPTATGAEHPSAAAALTATATSRTLPWRRPTWAMVFALAALSISIATALDPTALSRWGFASDRWGGASVDAASSTQDVLDRQASQTAVSLLTVGQLMTSAARREAPFETELALAYRLVGDVPPIVASLDGLLQAAGTGAPSAETLAADFATLRPRLEELAKGKPRFLASVGGALTNLAAATGLSEGADSDPLDAIIAIVEGALAQGDLQRALAAGEQLGPPGSSLIDPWLTALQTRVAIDTNLAELTHLIHRTIMESAP